METRLLRRSTLEQDLPGALSRGELDLRFQPIVELPARRPVGVEALLAWRHPTLGAVPAGELLPLAEDLGLLPEVGALGAAPVVPAAGRLAPAARVTLAGGQRAARASWSAPPSRRACRPRWRATGSRRRPWCSRSPSRTCCPYATTSAEVEDLAAHLGRLRAQGIRTAVDNFGAGPTSLSRLRILPIDLLKIDRDVFGQPAGAYRQLGPVMDVTVALGQRLGLEVIAHGLQAPDDLDTVQAAGCRLGQGDLLGLPMPAEHLEALLEQHVDTPNRKR